TDPQLFHFCFVAIGHEASVEPAAGAGCVSHGGGKQAARAGFRASEHPATIRQQPSQPWRVIPYQFITHDSTPSLTGTAITNKLYAAARISSHMTPNPFLRRLSKKCMGGGLMISKRRNMTNASSCAQKPAGASHSISQKATISSQTMPPWSGRPISLPTR